jgi:hypothetical protein
LELGWIEKILDLHNFTGALVILKEMLEGGEIIVHVDCIGIEVDAH